MSHFTTVKTQIKDIGALRDAAAQLGLAMQEGGHARGYLTKTIRGEYVLRLKGPYDIAVNREPDGNFGLTTDWWDGHVEKEVGQKYAKLLHLYGIHKATLIARKHGLLVSRQTRADGSVKLVASGVGI